MRSPAARSGRGPARPPAWLATDSNFSDSTGSTQGMTLRISPPRSATARIDSSPRPAGRRRAGERCGDKFGRPGAIDQGQGQLLADDVRCIGAADRHREPGNAPTLRKRRRRPAGRSVGDAFDKQIRRVKRGVSLLRSRTTSAASAPPPATVADMSSIPAAASSARHPGAAIGDQRRLRPGRGDAGRQCQIEGRRIGNADLGAGGVIDRGVQRHRLSRPRRGSVIGSTTRSS